MTRRAAGAAGPETAPPPAAPAPARAVATRSFPGRPESAAAARAWTASCLPGCPVLDDVVLCVSELVTNSVLYSASARPGGVVTVRVEHVPGWALVDVIDQGDAPERAGEHGLGTGWPLVRELSEACGRDGGRAWFVVTWPARPALTVIPGGAQ